MRVWQPGMEREHRHFDRKRQGECSEEPELLIDREPQLQQVRQVKAPTSSHFVVGPPHPQDSQKHQQATCHGKQEEFDRGIDTSLATPDTDQQVHGNQHDLPKHIEEKEIRGE